MAYLLDTHTYLWFVSGDSKLPESTKNIIADINQNCYISIASFWEITIKHQLGKLEIDLPLNELFAFSYRNQIEILDITLEHLLTLSNLPSFHQDPFDRLIISQSISENLTLISKDKNFKNYKANVIW